MDKTLKLSLDDLENNIDLIHYMIKNYPKLLSHSYNQRKMLAKQNDKINHLKDSVDFDDCVVDLANDTINKLSVKNHKLNSKCKEYKNRYKAIEKDNNNHLGKLIEVQHILNRDDSNMEFH